MFYVTYHALSARALYEKYADLAAREEAGTRTGIKSVSSAASGLRAASICNSKSQLLALRLIPVSRVWHLWGDSHRTNTSTWTRRCRSASGHKPGELLSVRVCEQRFSAFRALFETDLLVYMETRDPQAGCFFGSSDYHCVAPTSMTFKCWRWAAASCPLS